jgi:cyanophycin synthetase
MRVEKVINIPLTYDGKAEFNIANTLGAVMACFLRDFRIEDIRQALQTFVPSPAQTPGRLNMFRFKHFTVMLDYAHNAHGMIAIGKLVNKIEASKKVGIIAGVGDRRDEDTIALAEEAAKVFDEIIIRQDKNLRGKTDHEIIDLLSKGIRNIKPNCNILVIPKESEAIDYAIKHAEKDSFITVISDVVPDALEQVKRLREEEENDISASQKMG